MDLEDKEVYLMFGLVFCIIVFMVLCFAYQSKKVQETYQLGVSEMAVEKR